MGSLKFAIGSRASFHPKSCRRPLQFLPCSSRCPRAAGSESLKCSFFTFPLREICFKMSVCSRSVFYWEVLRKWLRLEFLSPYLRLFSFCDYTISHPRLCVHSQSSQRCGVRFVQVRPLRGSGARGIIEVLGPRRKMRLFC